MKKTGKEFLEELSVIFDTTTEKVQISFKEYMIDFEDRDPMEMLHDINFWKRIASFLGMSDEEFEKTVKNYI